MARLELILIFALQFEAGISRKLIYRRPGEDAILPCATVSSSDPTCSNVSWLYNRDRSLALTEVKNGNVRESSARVDRLRVDISCSLVINNITAEDAGRYVCQQGGRVDQDVFLSVLTGISGGTIYLYNRPGEDVILPCATASSSDPTCSNVLWLYARDQYTFLTEVQNGNFTESSARADRLRVDTNCSLVINNITAEDVGAYVCRQGGRINQYVFLSVLTVSPSPPDADPNRDGEVTLECSLLKYSDLTCRLNSFRWLDETGTVLRGDGVKYSFLRQRKCVSSLTVKRQSDHYRKYTCQFIDKQNNAEIQADYTPDFTDPTGWSPLSYVMLALRIAGLILMIVITALLIRHTWNKKTLDNDNKVENDGVQYENVEARGSPAAAAAAAAAATTTTTTTAAPARLH